MYKNLFVILSFISPICFGAVPSSKTLSLLLSDQAASVSKLAGQIKYLDKKISSTNDDYLSKLKNITVIEKKVELLKSKLKESAGQISGEYNNSKHALNLYLLETVDDDNQDSLIHKEIYLEILKKKFINLERAQRNSSDLLETINLYDQRLTQTKATEEIMYGLILKLENQKKVMSKSYITKLENKNLTETKLDKIKAKARAYKKTYRKNKRKNVAKRKRTSRGKTRNIKIIPMMSPIDDYIEMKQNKNAVVLKYKSTVAVRAPSSGKVVYTGTLASYGNIIMIDHGQEVKSVLLGDMHIKVKKGDSLKKGQLIGYTLSDPGVIKSLHYEIRKKSFAVNAAKWITNGNITKI